MDTEAIMVMTSIDSREKAERLAELMLSADLSACVQISSKVRSYYEWQGKLEAADEFVVSFKTLKSKSNDLIQAIRENHEYEVPEIIAVDLDRVDGSYLTWMQSVLT